MKKNNRRLFGVMGLSALSLSAFAIAFSSSHHAAIGAHAVSGDTWMINFVIDVGEIAGYMNEGSLGLQTFTDGVGDTLEFYPHRIDENKTLFQVNATFPEDYTFDRIQYWFLQGDVQKWGDPVEVSGEEGSHHVQISSSFVQWTGKENIWEFDAHNYDPYFDYGKGAVQFIEDPGKDRFVIRDIALKGDETVTLNYRGSSSGITDWFTSTSLTYAETAASSFITFKAGTYDLIWKNDSVDNGIFDLIKHDAAPSSIYLVDFEADAYIYTFSDTGVESFGAFPGQRLGDIDDAATILGDIHFQNHNWKIWEVPMQIGYPTADHIIVSYLNEFGKVGVQTADMYLKDKAAYWFSYDDDYCNADAGKALGFLKDAEAARLDALNHSVCNIDAAACADLLSQYEELGDDIQSTYVDVTTVNTYKEDKTQGTEYVPYEHIVERLAEQAESLGGIAASTAMENHSNTVLVVTLCAMGAAAAVAGLVLFMRKPRKGRE